MQRVILTVLLIPVLAGAAFSARALEIFFIDVEGGGSTLIVTPAGQSLLIDAGYGGRWRSARSSTEAVAEEER